RSASFALATIAILGQPPSKIKGQWFFLYGFAKNERDSISDQALRVLQVVAGSWLEQEPHQLQQAIVAGELKEVRKDDI
ncbi:type II toxin-antitoxin system RelE/ParE family toxin, partial [Nitrosomonas sp. ANs5]|uniref:type II toxin-antitoxin system RelE/ParE family toxin n=1 Tax=Nitrosomonas sp. ANs5 TaxID=3423941 RepID=UPI003D334C77